MTAVRLTHLDGKLPNLALMRLARWHRDRGDEVYFTRRIERGLFEPTYARVYGSAIFRFSAARIKQLRNAFPSAIIGGTGSGDDITVEEVAPGPEHYDYTDYPEFAPSIGFTARGCRLKCKFCVVPAKEGKPRPVNTIADIWRGQGHPRQLHLLDNDFFGQPRDEWRARLMEIREGEFKVCFNQGINVRLVDDEIAAELANVEYRDDQFRERRLYTAWDNLRDEAVFFRGIERLTRAGVKPKHIMVYMLVGYDQAETEERVLYRFRRMVERGLEPYPMVYDRSRRDLCAFQRWVVTGLYRSPDVPWSKYRHYARRKDPNCGQQEMPV